MVAGLMELRQRPYVSSPMILVDVVEEGVFFGEESWEEAAVDPSFGWSIIGSMAVQGSFIHDDAGELGRGELSFLRKGMLQSSEQGARCSGRFPDR